jgi:transcriptional regulator with XRE-family HTH domain
MGKKKATGFGGKLRALREAAGLTQAQLAERAGMHLHGITKLEQGDREPAWATVLLLARTLGVSCEAFAGDEPPGEVEPAPPRPRGRPRKAATQEPAPAEPEPPKRPRGKK